jgi:hypothetical protein
MSWLVRLVKVYASLFEHHVNNNNKKKKKKKEQRMSWIVSSLKVSCICKTFYATSIRFQPFFFFCGQTPLNLNSKSCRQSKHSVRHTWPMVLQHVDRCDRISSPLPSIQLDTLYWTMVTKLNLEVVYLIIFKKN